MRRFRIRRPRQWDWDDDQFEQVIEEYYPPKPRKFKNKNKQMPSAFQVLQQWDRYVEAKEEKKKKAGDAKKKKKTEIPVVQQLMLYMIGGPIIAFIIVNGVGFGLSMTLHNLQVWLK